MKLWIAVAAVSCSAIAFAQPAKDTKPAAPAAAPAKDAAGKDAKAAPAAGGMDMSKMGPWTRKVKDEGAVKKEITAFFKAHEELEKKGDMEAALASIDFPVLMITDDASGKVEATQTTKEQYVAMMKPFYENMPKDMKTTHKQTITVLSDALAVVVDDFTMTSGKNKMAGKNSSMLIKKDGKWMWKAMAEAGWGGETPAGTGGSAPTMAAPKADGGTKK